MMLDAADFKVVQKITSKDRSNLYLTSQFIDDPKRYQAFLSMYAIMRVVDDSVDEVEDKQRLEPAALADLHHLLNSWMQRIDAAYDGQPADDALDRALAWAVHFFPVPKRYWQAFIQAMHTDVDQARFTDFADFLRYAQGATVAPTSLYVYLLCAEVDDDGLYRVRDFDYAQCGHDLGIFAYLAHILRDVREDALVGTRGLVYLSLDDLADQGLRDDDIRQFAVDGQGDARFSELVKMLIARARTYAQKGSAGVASIVPRLAADRAFVLRLIVAYYQALLDKVAVAGPGLFSGERLLTKQNKLVIAQSIATEVGFELDPQRLLTAAGHTPLQRVSSL